VHIRSTEAADSRYDLSVVSCKLGGQVAVRVQPCRLTPTVRRFLSFDVRRSTTTGDGGDVDS
jgi:hypothetical protein